MKVPDPSAPLGLVRGLWKSHTRKAVGPASEIRSALFATRSSAREVVAIAGGMRQGLMNREPDHDQALTDLAGRVMDKKLSALLRTIASDWREVLASSRVDRAGDFDVRCGPNPQEAKVDANHAAIQTGAAESALNSIEAALERLNKLEARTL